MAGPDVPPQLVPPTPLLPATRAPTQAALRAVASQGEGDPLKDADADGESVSACDHVRLGVSEEVPERVGDLIAVPLRELDLEPVSDLVWDCEVR